MSIRRHFSRWIPGVLAGVVFLGLSSGIARADTLTLEESIRIALENNPNVLLAEESVRKADAMVDEAFSAGRVKINVDGTYQRVDEVPVASLGDREVELGSPDSRSANLTVSQPIDIFGMIKTGRRAAKTGKAAYRYGVDGKVNDITLETKTAFYNVLRAQEFLKVQEQTINQLQAHLDDAKARYNAGTIAKFEVLRAETQLANVQQSYISAENGVDLAKASFNDVLGRPVDTPVELVKPEKSGFVDVELASCVDCASTARPEILQAEEMVAMNEGLTDVARLSGKPRFNFRWSYNRNMDVTMFNPRESSWQAFLTMSMPVYDGGATKAAVDQAESDTNSAKLRLEQMNNLVALDARQSYLSLKESRERIRASEKALEQARESERLAQVRYKGGVSTQVEVLDAQAALTLAETNYVNAQYDYQIALARLERAVGGRTQMAKLIEESQTVASDQTAK